MNKRFLNLALWMLFSAVLCGTGCSDDVTYPDVDGQEPVATLKLPIFKVELVMTSPLKEL